MESTVYLTTTVTDKDEEGRGDEADGFRSRLGELASRLIGRRDP